MLIGGPCHFRNVRILVEQIGEVFELSVLTGRLRGNVAGEFYSVNKLFVLLFICSLLRFNCPSIAPIRYELQISGLYKVLYGGVCIDSLRRVLID